MHVDIDPDNYEYIPAEKEIDYYDNDINQIVAIYVRVSTDDVRQTTSFELQKLYYEDFVKKHPNWTLYKIYADEGISGTTTDGRKEFNAMIAEGLPQKLEHHDIKWITPAEIPCFEFCPADEEILKKICEVTL